MNQPDQSSVTKQQYVRTREKTKKKNVLLSSLAARARGKYSRNSPSAIAITAAALHLQQVARRAHHHLQVSAFALVEHPLDVAVEQRGVRQVRHRTIEPEVDAGDRRVLETVGARCPTPAPPPGCVSNGSAST